MSLALMLLPFLALVGAEAVYSARNNLHWYRLNDAIANLSAGALMILTVGYFEPSGATFEWVYDRWSTGLLARPDWLTYVIAFIALDFILYWLHIAQHKLGILWAVHVVHHQSEELNYSVGLRQSSFLYVMSWIFLVPFALAGFSFQVMLTVHGVSLLYQFLVHTRATSRVPVMEWVFVTPAHHRVHHGKNEAYLDKNFGAVLIVWDRLFGTFAQEKPGTPIEYGIRTRLNTWNPLAANLAVFGDLLRALVRRMRPGAPMRADPVVAGRDFVAKRSGVAQASLREEPKFDPLLPRELFVYGLVQISVCIGLIVNYLFRLSGSHIVNADFHALFLVTSFVAVPTIFDGRASFLAWEKARLILVVVIGLVNLVALPESLYLSCILVLWGSGSGIYLWLRQVSWRQALQVRVISGPLTER